MFPNFLSNIYRVCFNLTKSNHHYPYNDYRCKPDNIIVNFLTKIKSKTLSEEALKNN